MIAADLIRRGAQYYAGKTAVIFGDRTLTFEEVNCNANRLANALRRLGLKKGDRVAFLLANSVQSVEIDFAIIKSGLVRVPLNTRLSEKEHLHMIHETEAKALLFSEAFRDRVAALRPQLPSVRWFCQVDGHPVDWTVSLAKEMEAVTAEEPEVHLTEDDWVTIQYTSGTTGKLKAAVHTQGSWSSITTNILLSLRIEKDDIMLHAAPLTHASGTLVLPHWIRGGVNAILPGFKPAEFLRAVENIRPTTLNLVPTMIAMLLAEPDVEKVSFESVRQIIYGASPMPRETLKKAMRLWGARFIQYYGQTECPLILTLLDMDDHVSALENPKLENRLLSCGRPTVSTQLKIVDEEGRELPPGEIGEIAVRSTQQMSHYFQAPELTRETIRDGWIHTRDMGYIDQDGFVYLVDRKSDMIISGGFNIYPREVEEVLYQHPAVMEAAVVGVPHDRWGEVGKAFVVLKEGCRATEEELVEFCRQHLASYKRPHSVEFVDSLPKSAVGKVVRRVLREPYWQGRERPI
jgi:acyl-CoA synthetase (AMP-forming)/AMP-acid ligase II